MKFSAERESLLAALQSVIGVVERRQTMPILANLLLSADQGKLSITATDLEVELVAAAEIKSGADGKLTVPGRKLLDICRSLPEGVTLTFTQDGDKLTVKAGRSRFVLATLPAADFPMIDELAQQQSLQLAAGGSPPASRQDAFLDGAAGRSLLPERDVAGNGRENAANGRD